MKEEEQKMAPKEIILPKVGDRVIVLQSQNDFDEDYIGIVVTVTVIDYRDNTFCVADLVSGWVFPDDVWKYATDTLYAKGRIPQVGDRIRLLTDNGLSKTRGYIVGDTYEVESVTRDLFAIGVGAWIYNDTGGEQWEFVEYAQSNNVVEPSVEAKKYDLGKPPMDLLDRTWLEEVSKVLAFGATKYGPHNWRSGIEFSRLIAAALRHLHAFNDGENLDTESGLPHIAHASCCLMFLMNGYLTHLEKDDRYKA
jgi:hypothetical protein